jgi:formate dehydrogenase major subunit
VAEVQNGVWLEEEPMFDHPISHGGLCAKGASLRGNVASENRLKYPMKLEGGKWGRISWNQALDEISGQLLQIREQYGADAVQWLGSAHFSNEEAYIFRKLAALWGTNNVDHQARI